MAAGASVHRGDMCETESLTEAVVACDAVIHTAFNHDFSRFAENCETDRQVIMALGSALMGTVKPLVITSGIGLLKADRAVIESDLPPPATQIPRAATEEAARAVSAMGVKTYVVRLPPTVHGRGDHGFITMIAAMATQKGESVFIGDGLNRWPAVHRDDAAVIYRLIIEKIPDQKVFHAVAESGIDFRKIAEAIGGGLRLPTVSKKGSDAEEHFGWFTYFASMDCTASSELTRKTLAWTPVQPGLMDDLSDVYF